MDLEKKKLHKKLKEIEKKFEETLIEAGMEDALRKSKYEAALKLIANSKVTATDCFILGYLVNNNLWEEKIKKYVCLIETIRNNVDKESLSDLERTMRGLFKEKYDEFHS